MDLLQRDTQHPQLSNDEQSQDLILRVIAVVALVLAVFRHQEVDFIIIPQRLDGNTAQRGDLSNGVIAFSLGHRPGTLLPARR